ncbi:leucine--tRNA ligase, partial [Patescibacteria group bacterium]|nr:leucine--tRNA ligase [Patescibacteria group bacterium]
KKSDLERGELNKEKTGVKIEGLEVINPVNNQVIPLFVADYVLANYGFGAVMAVPAHDQRDWEFAENFGLEKIQVITPIDQSILNISNTYPWPINDDFKSGDSTIKRMQKAMEVAYGVLLKKGAEVCFMGEGIVVNSGEFNGLTTAEFKKRIVTWLEKNNTGKKAVNYKLRDWIFSRQRYWGEPIPMIYCQKCQWQTVPEDQLPVILPDILDFMPTEDGQSPLAKVDSWVHTTCPKCGGPAERETDVMPNWAGSNWYFIRYCDPQNNKQMIDPQKASYWLPVDWYNGGMEHTTLHLLYSRFVYKFLYDIKAVPEVCGSEPYAKRTAQGMVLGEGGIKMSKSKGNVINPDGYIQKYGADTVRLYEMFMGPFDQSIAWDDQGVVGMFRFLKKVFALQEKVKKEYQDQELVFKILHQSIKKVGLDIESMRFNTAVAQLTILLKELEKAESISENLFSKFILILAPFAPHLAEELWSLLGHQETLAYEPWPAYDEDLAKAENIILGIQVNGKLRDTIELALDTIDSAELKNKVLALPKVQAHIENKEVKKYLHIKNKIISIVV